MHPSAAHLESQRDGYTITTDPARLDRDLVHAFLTSSYWAAGVPRDVVERSIEHSIVFGVYRGAVQVGFARVVTDRATFAYLADVFVLPEHRGLGVAGWLVATVLRHRSCRACDGGCWRPRMRTGSTSSTASPLWRTPAGSWSAGPPTTAPDNRPGNPWHRPEG